MTNHYNGENLKKIEELKEILRGYKARREIGNLIVEKYDAGIESFVTNYGCDYDFFTQFGVEIFNSEHEDMRSIIENFIKSNCKSWDEYCIYLLEKLIGIIRESQ